MRVSEMRGPETPYEEGAAAYGSGEALEANPYMGMVDEGSEWARGWGETQHVKLA